MAHRILGLLAVGVLLLGLFPHAASAQARPAPRTRVPVIIALVDRLPQPDAPFVILRRAGPRGSDVILLRPDADAVLLSAAVQALLTTRRAHGDVAANHATLRVRPRQAGKGPRPLPWAPRVISDLRRASRREVAGMGAVPAVDVWLPRQAGRRTTR